MSRGFCYSSSNGLGWSVNQVQWSKWKLGKKLCVTNSGHIAGHAPPQRLHPGARGECTRQGPAGARMQGMEVTEAGENRGLFDNTALPPCLWLLSGWVLPFPGLSTQPTWLSLIGARPVHPPSPAPAAGRAFMDKVSYRTTRRPCWSQSRPDFLESPHVLPNKR